MEDHLLYRVLTGQATPAEQHAVEGWRRASAAHEARYEALRTLLATTRRPAPVDSAPPPVLEVLELAARRERARGRRARPRRLALAVGGIAALLVAGVGLGRWVTRANGRAFGFEEMVTGENQTVTVALRDGSVMRLAPRSHARLRILDGRREVQLTGHAFFSVAKRDGLPFVVKTAGGDVTVLGTQFDLDATNQDVRLVVVEGRVALAAARGGEARVERGQAARVVDGRLQPTVQLDAPREATRWVGRFLAFQATPLREVAREIARTYGATVTIADSTLADHTVTNWFSDKPLDEVVQVVCALVAAECVVQGNHVSMGSSPP